MITETTRLVLSAHTPAVVPSGPVVLEVEGVEDVDQVRLDGAPLRGAYDPAGRRVTAALNLQRATGYHILRVGARRRYLFGTDDAKLRIEGVVEMLDYLRTQADSLGLAWSGVVQFSGTQTVVRDHRLDVAWIDECAPEVAALGAAIAKRPFFSRRYRHVRATHGLPDVAATAALIRRQPHLMERFAGGQVKFEGESWTPRELVRREREHYTDTPGNRMMTSLLVATLALVKASQAAAPAELRGNLEPYVHDLARLTALEPFRTIRRLRGHTRLSPYPSVEERSDDRYRRGRRLLQALLRGRHWDPTATVADEWAFARLADQVYQAFVALLIAHAWHLAPVRQLGGEGPHFASDDYELWVDSVPPASVLKNWRDATLSPVALRPDLVLRRIADDQVALLDAKYRNVKAHGASASLTEAQLYLQAFECRHISVIFPPASKAPPWAPRVITDGRYSITELPLRPADDLSHYLTAVVRPAVDRTFQETARRASQRQTRDAEEAATDGTQRAAVRTLLADGEVVRLTQPGAMRPAENSLRRALPDVWDDLGEDLQRMLITAEYFGDQVPDGFDHSGPVLGLFAACERLVRDRLLNPLNDQVLPGEFSRATFGEAAEFLRRLPHSPAPREKRARAWLQARGATDLRPLAACGKTMGKANRWRVSAAHSVLVGKDVWDKSYRVVLGASPGLLNALADALPPL